MLINKRKNPLVTHLIVGLKNEHGLYKILKTLLQFDDIRKEYTL